MASPLIFDLPLELLKIIIDYFEFPDTAHLRATCRLFASLIPEQSSHFLNLLATEDSAWALKRRRVTCVYCARMRRASAFTDKQKTNRAEFRSCIECQEAESGMDGRIRWCWDVPSNRHRTCFSDAYRKLKVDRLERGICQYCHNRFNRWGRTNAGRAICSGCFLDHPRESRMVEANRLCNDLRRMGKECIENWPTGGFNGDDLEAIRTDREREWWYWYEWDWDYVPQIIPVWRGGTRGVTVRSREEAEDLLVIVDLEHVPHHERREAAQAILATAT